MTKSDDDRTLDMLEGWCGTRPSDLGKQLINLWEETRNNSRRPHTSIDFQPDGVEDLINKLKKEFRNAPGRHITLTPRSFDPNGRIRTISVLMDAVGSSDPLDQAALGMERSFVPSQPAAIDDETARLFRLVNRWSGDFPVHVLEPLIEIWERTRASAQAAHKKTPYMDRGIKRLAKELKQEYRELSTSPGVESFAPAGPVADCADLLRLLHSAPDTRRSAANRAKPARRKKGRS